MCLNNYQILKEDHVPWCYWVYLVITHETIELLALIMPLVYSTRNSCITTTCCIAVCLHLVTEQLTSSQICKSDLSTTDFFCEDRVTRMNKTAIKPIM